MTFNYKVAHSTSATGPWSNDPLVVNATTDTITGLLGSTNYFFQIIAVDAASGATGPAAVFGPFPTASASQEAVEGAFITTVGPTMNASRTMGVASSGPFDVWSLINQGAGQDPVVARNTVATPSGTVAQIVYHNHDVYQSNTGGGWWYWNTASLAWIEFGVSSVSLSAFNYAANAPANTTIGTVTVAMLNTPAFSGTYTLSDTTHFKMVGNVLQSNSTLSATSYPLTITAIPAISGSQSIGEQGQLVTTLSQTGTQTLTAPVVAANAGYHTLLWSDDFTTNTLAASGQGFVAGKKWWFGNQDHITNGDCVVNTTMTAATVPLGIGAGPNASSAGGILLMNGSNPSNGGNGFLMSTSNIAATLPTTTQGVFNKVYVEYYIAYDPRIRVNQGGDSGPKWFPALWSWTWEGRQGGGFGVTQGTDSATSTEIDFMEETSGVFGNPLGFQIGSQGFFPGGGPPNPQFANSSFSGITTPQWHTYGFLWDQSNNVSFYRDGVKGSGAPFQMDNINSSFKNQHIFIIMGTGYQWPVYVDWVRVWGLP